MKFSNPYAFSGPTYEANGHATYQEGMTLRDYFAGQALAAGANPHHAYQQADSMLALRHLPMEELYK